MSEVKAGSEVSVHYTGTLDDGTVFDTSVDKEPLTFVVGEQQVIPGFEEAVLGMGEGESKTVSLSPEQGYGPYQDQMVFEADKSELPEGVEEGSVLQSSVQGTPVFFTVTHIENNTVTLDGNHPLAGKSLNFEIELLAVS